MVSMNRVRHIIDIPAGKQRLALIVGLAFFWPSLHASPYYPLTLSMSAFAKDVAEVSACHILYTVMLVCTIVALAFAVKRLGAPPTIQRMLAAGSGILGLLGGLALCTSSFLGQGEDFAIGAGLVLTAAYVGIFIVAWGSIASRASTTTTAFDIAVSYGLFCLFWLTASLLHLGQTLMLALCPGVSASLLMIATHQASNQQDPVFSNPYTTSSLRKALPLSLLVLCATFVYFGVISVRVLTTMQTGADQVGAPATHQLITLTASLLACLCLALFSHKKEYSTDFAMAVFAGLVLLYMAALLMVAAAGESSLAALVGKRTLVAGEHVVEVFIFISLACTTGKKNLDATVVFGGYAIVIVALPQLISLDFMYRSGVLEALASINLIVPIAAVGLFAVAAVTIGLLTSYSARISRAAAQSGESWQKELCRQALAGIDVSPREFEVAALVYRGHSAKKIAETLLVSESTVKTHIAHLYRKLDIHSKQEFISLIDQYRGGLSR